MSSEVTSTGGRSPLPSGLQETLPRSVVPTGLDPVEQARAELKAALFAIEEKVNVPKRIAHGVERTSAAARRFAARNPSGAAAAALVIAGTVGTAVWGLVSLYTRSRR